MKLRLAWILGLSFIATFAVFIWIQMVEASRARVAFERSLLNQRALQGESEKLTEQLETAKTRIRASLNELNAQQRKKAAAQGEKPRAVMTKPKFFDLLQKDPEYQAKWLAARRTSLLTIYGGYLRTAGFDPRETEQFLANALKWEEQKMDLNASFAARGVSLGDAAAQKMLAEARADFEAKQREMLSETAFAQWKDYERTTPVRDIVSGYAGASVLTGEPFTVQQSETLVKIMANASETYQKGEQASPGTVDWAMVDAQAEAILSPAQLRFFISTEPSGPNNAFGRYHSQFWNIVSNAQLLEAKSVSSSEK